MGVPVVVAVDVGTSGVKAVAATRDGRILGARVRPYTLRTPAPGWVEQDLDEIVTALADATRSLVADTGLDLASVAGIGVTAQMFNVVPVDADLRPMGPMLSWLDQRAAGQAAALAGRVPLAEQYRTFDAAITAKDIVPRILWLRDERPDVLARTAWLLDCKEAIVGRLTGRAVIDVAGASAFRLLDPATLDWDERRCALAGIPRRMLPEVRPATAIAGPLTQAAGAITGLRAGTPVVVGAGDVAATQVGAGAIRVGDVHLSLGTAVYFGVTTDRPARDPGGRLGVIGHVVPGLWVLWLEVATGGGALTWLLRALGGRADGGGGSAPVLADAMADVDRLVEDAASGMDDLLFAPWLSGERVPVFDDRVRAAFVGLSLSHRREHLLRAVMEGVATQMRWAYDYGRAYGVPFGAIRAVGGGSIGEAWTQIIADALGEPLEVVRRPQEAGARGAAACALVGTGLQPDVRFMRDTVGIERVVAPEPAGRRGAERRLDLLRRLYDALAPLAREAAPDPGRASSGIATAAT